ncbi:MAG TPA: hypothetical protein VNR88_01485 [Hyphomicrobium sp.]|nr:hypothetical protein [Hyphomicrobium sp.]
MGVAARSHPWRRRALLCNACCLALTPFAAVAAEVTASLASVRVRYDDTRWRVSDRGEWLRFNPLGEIARDRDPVGLHVLNDAASCAELARAAFDGGRYDKQSLAASGVSIGGLTAERFAAHTGCRNATPRGVIICVKHGGHAYLLQALNAGCTGRNLFTSIDPLAEIANGIHFEISPK